MSSCKKRRYKDKISAMFALSQCRKESATGNRHECRVYLCPLCGMWHLTSKKTNRIMNKILNGWKKWTEEKPNEGEPIIVYECSLEGYCPVHCGPAIYRLIDEYNKFRLDRLYWIKLPTFK